MKFVLFVGLIMVSLGDASTTAFSIASEDYTQVALHGTLSFLFFHLAAMLLKHGMKPWKVVGTFAVIAGLSGLSAIKFLVGGELVSAFGQAVVCITWGFTARSAYRTRLLLKAEQDENN